MYYKETQQLSQARYNDLIKIYIYIYTWGLKRLPFFGRGSKDHFFSRATKNGCAVQRNEFLALDQKSSS